MKLAHILQRKEPIYVFPKKELRGLNLNFHVHVSVSDLYIPRISPHIFLQQNFRYCVFAVLGVHLKSFTGWKKG